MNYIPRTPRPYSKPEVLLDIYHWMLQFEVANHFKPAIEEIAEEFEISTSVARFYLGHMEKLGMGRQPKLTRKKTGREISPSRSYILLPLEKADVSITNYLKAQKEK
jgi:hypothetical protein